MRTPTKACNRSTTETRKSVHPGGWVRFTGEQWEACLQKWQGQEQRGRGVVQALPQLPQSSAEGLFWSIPFPSWGPQEAEGKQQENSLCPWWHPHPLTLGHIPFQTSQASGYKGLVAQSIEEQYDGGWVGLKGCAMHVSGSYVCQMPRYPGVGSKILHPTSHDLGEFSFFLISPPEDAKYHLLSCKFCSNFKGNIPKDY